jgi:hypothetical protein
MVRMKALKRFPYFGKALAVGESFDASESDARVFQIIGHAEIDGNRADLPPAGNTDAQHYLTRDMTASRRRGKKVEA